MHNFNYPYLFYSNMKKKRLNQFHVPTQIRKYCGCFDVLAELAELALVHQVDQLTHLVNDVTTDQLMNTTYLKSLETEFTRVNRFFVRVGYLAVSIKIAQ